MSVVDFVLIVILQDHTFSIICAKIIIKKGVRQLKTKGVQLYTGLRMVYQGLSGFLGAASIRQN